MIKKTITYTDLDENEKTEDFWFQITQAEFVRKAMEEGGDAYLGRLQRLANASEKDGKEIMENFEYILRDAVGKRDGQLLRKSKEITDHFMYSGAYDAFFMELIQTPDSGAKFMRAMLPKDARGAIDKAMKERGMTVPGEATDVTPQPTPFPQSLEKAVEAQEPTVGPQTPSGVSSANAPELQAAPPQLAEARKDDEPEWFQENRYPTKSELMKMSPDELQFAMKMKSSKAFG